jgi:hypothetical protein
MARAGNRRGSKRQETPRDPCKPSSSRLLRETFAALHSVLWPCSVVVVVGALPLQLTLTAVAVSRGFTDDSLLLLQAQALIDWVFGSVIISAVYATLAARLEGRQRQSIAALLRLAYRNGLRTWIGLFLTRGMVGFVVGIASLPVLLGLWIAGRISPRLMALTADPSAVATLSLSELAALLIVIPFAIPALSVFVRYLLADAVVALEHVDGFEAMQRSRALMQGAGGAALLALLPLLLPLEILGLLTARSGDVVGPWGAAVFFVGMMVLNVVVEILLFQLFRQRGGAIL